jgi:hypothetical protein
MGAVLDTSQTTSLFARPPPVLVSESGSRFFGPYLTTLRGQKTPPVLGKMGAPIFATSLSSSLLESRLSGFIFKLLCTLVG